MLYLLGVNLPDEKTVPIALTRIYGIGLCTSQSICDKLSIHRFCKLKDLPESKLVQLSQLLNKMTIETELKRQVKQNIKNLSQIGTYRGERHAARLPVRGQKTRTNARTARTLNGYGLKRQFST